jgi:TAT (twin-arginine translocation) pathway signal sequence
MAVDTEHAERSERRGLSRRDMIKASAAAGAVAWTAPVIIDSLASPAAAATFTPPCGCTNYTFNSQCGPDNQGTKCNTNPACATQSDLLANCFSADCTTGNTIITYHCQQFTTCTPGLPQAKQTGSDGGCVDPDVSTTSMGPWTFLGADHYAQFSVFLTCPAC